MLLVELTDPIANKCNSFLNQLAFSKITKKYDKVQLFLFLVHQSKTARFLFGHTNSISTDHFKECIKDLHGDGGQFLYQ